MNKLIIILFYLLINLPVVAQLRGYDIKQTNKDLKISMNDIIGNWYTTDSSANKITFININNYFVNIDGIHHGVGNYIFRIFGDSISVNGTAPNWPPYDCTLRLLKDNLLEIEFYQFSDKVTTKVIYKR